MKEQVLSVGIDIGTTTTQLVFSQLTLENTASLVTVPRIEIIAKEVIYRSAIHFTPLRSQSVQGLAGNFTMIFANGWQESSACLILFQSVLKAVMVIGRET